MEHKKSFKSIIRNSLLFILFLFIVIYTHSRTAFLSQGVSLSVENLKDGQTLSSRVLTLEGSAKRAVKLTINNREVLIDEKGGFEDTIILYPGINILIIEAQDKFDNYKKLEYTVWHTSETTVQHVRDNFLQHIYSEPKSPTPTIDLTRIEQEEITQEEILTN